MKKMCMEYTESGWATFTIVRTKRQARKMVKEAMKNNVALGFKRIGFFKYKVVRL